jgi:hypothetical protein
MLIHVQKNELLNELTNEYWHDSETVAGFISFGHKERFPSTINYSGYRNFNLHLLIKGYFRKSSYLELIFVSVENLEMSFVNGPGVIGRLGTLGNVILFDNQGRENGKAAALLHQFLVSEEEFIVDYRSR